MKKKIQILIISALITLLPTMLNAQTNPFGYPLIPDMVADPSIIEVDGTFYCYVTTDGYGQGLETSGPPVVWKSKDFVNWSFEGTYFPQAEKEKYWAPSKAVQYNGKWYIYPTINGQMFPAVGDGPDGPFRLAKGNTFTLENQLYEKEGGVNIDTEIFIDDDGQRYAIWGERRIARLKEDMVTIDTLVTIPTRKKNYTEGPIFFKRKGIYYYLYTNMALERYEYFYQMSSVSPFGPYTTPKQDNVCTTNAETGVFGPGHGCVFNVEGTDDYYLCYLEFSRNSTNRQIYVNRLEFNDDGTIKPVKVDLNGVGALRPSRPVSLIKPVGVTASSVAEPFKVPYKLDKRCQRTEYFVPEFAVDGSNGSCWMAAPSDSITASLTLDMGSIKNIGTSRIAFVRPTAGHAYKMEGSKDGVAWEKCGGHDDARKLSPHVDAVNGAYRYLRVTITEGIKGIWEWTLEENSLADFSNAKWIAMEPDSTIIFPHIHLLRANSPEARSMKNYALPILSKTFKAKGKIRKAWADICGLGQYEFFVNGEKMGNNFLSPGWTKYDKKLLYNEIDVTKTLRKLSGKNVELKLALGNGMYNIPTKGYHKMAGSCGAPKLLFCLHLEFEDGTQRTIVSDESWSAQKSPVTFSSIYAGEQFDARITSPSQPVVITAPKWDVPLVKQGEGSMVKVRKELPSKKIGSNLYDLQQNASGIVRIKVKGKKGSSISLRPAEILKNGRISQKSMSGYEWKYTLSGNKKGETWQPQFSYTGFRYVEVIADEGVELLELTGLHTSTDAEEAGTFQCSDTLYNKIHSLIDWAIRSNLVSISTDCPTREKLGWLEQLHLMEHSVQYRYGVQALMNKIIDDMADSQHHDGSIPTTAPEYTPFEVGSGFEDTPEWGASFILAPWYVYNWYGDDTALRKHYDNMKCYISYLKSRCKDDILDYGLGDWFDVGPNKPGKAQLTSVALSATAMYHYLLTTMSSAAAHLGKTNDADYFNTLATRVKDAFNKRFYVGGEKVYENGSQAALSMALYMNLVPDSLKASAVDALVKDIKSHNYAVTAGDIGYRYVLQALQNNGLSGIIDTMTHNDTIPGYAYQLKKGATALTESWQAYDDVSNNHMMLGHLMEWLYSGLGGIRQENESTGWKHIVINPQMVSNVEWTNVSLNTPQGLVSCKWNKSSDGKSWTMDIIVPEGSDATIYCPDGSVKHLQAGRHHLTGKADFFP